MGNSIGEHSEPNCWHLSGLDDQMDVRNDTPCVDTGVKTIGVGCVVNMIHRWNPENLLLVLQTRVHRQIKVTHFFPLLWNNPTGLCVILDHRSASEVVIHPTCGAEYVKYFYSNYCLFLLSHQRRY